MNFNLKFTSIVAATVSMVELRRDAAGVLRRLKKGQRLVLTHRGKPVARLEPIETAKARGEPDAIDRLEGIAGDAGESLGNDEIDAIVYGR